MDVACQYSIPSHDNVRTMYIMQCFNTYTCDSSLTHLLWKHPHFWFQLHQNSNIDFSFIQNAPTVLVLVSMIIINNWVSASQLTSDFNHVHFRTTKSFTHPWWNIYTFLLQNGALWDSCLMHCGICEMGLFIPHEICTMFIVLWFYGYLESPSNLCDLITHILQGCFTHMGQTYDYLSASERIWRICGWSL